MKRLIWVILVAVLPLVAGAVSAQSLADVAKKEKERRKKLDSPAGRTVTDVELRRAGGPRIATRPSRTSTEGQENEGDASDSEGEGESESTEPVDERQNQEYWQGRLAPIDERIQQLEQSLSSPEMNSNPRGASQRQDLEARLARARADRQAVVDDARRKGVPPGWLR